LTKENNYGILKLINQRERCSMANREITVRQWIENFQNGMYDAGDFKTQCDAGWYDWFCKESSLARKTQKMGKAIARVTNEKILDNMYVFFKNNCPFDHPLYDQFKFCDLETGDVEYCISIDCGWYESKYVVHGQGSWENPIFECDSVYDLRDYFNKL
jgi:hypothetical protein